MGDPLSPVNTVYRFLREVREQEHLEQDRYLEALVALHRAANLTRSYLADAALVEQIDDNVGTSNPIGGKVVSVI